MGSEVEENKHSSSETTLKDYLNELCDYALSIGMSYDDFWYGDISMFKHYHNAQIMKTQRKNQEMWLQGLYIYSAIGDLAPILNGNIKRPKPRPYMNEPIPLTEDERIAQENRKIEKFKQYMLNLSKGGKKDG